MEHLSHTVVAVQICGIWKCKIFAWSAFKSDLAALGQVRQNIGGYICVRLDVVDIALILYRKELCVSVLTRMNE
jgi:hypothetical protein